MTLRWGIWRFVLVLFILTSIPLTKSEELDQTNIGVTEGDSFVFSVEKYYFSIDNVDNLSGYYLGTDPKNQEKIVAIEGEEFTITFTNITLNRQTAWGTYIIPIEISYNNIIIRDEIVLDGIGTYLVLTNWDKQKITVGNEIKRLENATDFNTFNGSIIDTPIEFGIKFEYTATDEGYNISGAREISYDKNSGVLLYEKNYYVREQGVERESIIKQKISEEATGLNIPGFEYAIIVQGILVVTIFKTLTKRR